MYENKTYQCENRWSRNALSVFLFYLNQSEIDGFVIVNNLTKIKKNPAMVVLLLGFERKIDHFTFFNTKYWVESNDFCIFAL